MMPSLKKCLPLWCLCVLRRIYRIVVVLHLFFLPRLALNTNTDTQPTGARILVRHLTPIHRLWWSQQHQLPQTPKQQTVEAGVQPEASENSFVVKVPHKHTCNRSPMSMYLVCGCIPNHHPAGRLLHRIWNRFCFAVADNRDLKHTTFTLLFLLPS